ncbi:MAG: lipocalin family protein [Sedimentisphaerales bacterium]|nr:lipocalin family protein [Sedimentisphaerales bacterium]
MKKSRICQRAKRLLLLAPALLAGCVSVPDGIEPVRDFDVQRYLGTWYEIARLDHSFERGLSNVSATYTRRDTGRIDVLNRGFDERSGKWKEARGRAYLVGDPTTAHLKVSFFRPFYGSYVVIALEPDDYAYAMVCGASRSYLWILAREKTLDRSVRDDLVARAQRLGFQTNELIFVEHNRSD